MTKLLLTAFLCFVLFAARANYTTPGTGATYTLSDLVTLSSGNVTFTDAYLVNDTVTISAGDVLSITTDEAVRFAAGTFFDVNGTIIIDPPTGVLFTAQNTTTGYLGMRINASPLSRLKKLTFEYAVSLRITDCSIAIDRCVFQYNNNSASITFGNGAIALNRSNTVITNSQFLHNQRAAIQSGANVDNAPVISNCLFLDNNTTNQNVPQINLGASGSDTVKILNNQILRASIRSGGIGFLPIGDVRAVITGNVIKNNRYGITFNGGANINALISYNVIDSNNTEGNPSLGGSGISFSGGSASSHQNTVVTGNYIRGNLWGITITPTSTGGGAKPNLGNLQNADTTDDGKNWIYGNTNTTTPNIQLYNNNVDDITAQNNYWGSDNPGEIEAGIFHKPDNAALGLVDYSAYIVLPVHLVNFQAAWKNGAANLVWETASESNSDYFLVEKSTDGQTFNSIGKVIASGNASGNKAYRFTDVNSAGTKLYYRLKLVDRDGRFTYSKVLLLIPGNDKETLNIYPTTFTGTQTITAQYTSTNNQLITVEWLTADGKTLQRSSEKVSTGVNTFLLHPQAGWPVGKLLVVCTGREEVKTISVIKY